MSNAEHWAAIASASSTQCVAESLRLDRKNLRTMSAADRMRAVVGALEQNAAGARQVVAPIGSFKRVTSGQLDPTTGKPIVVAVPMPEDPSHPLQKSSSLHEQIMESHANLKKWVAQVKDPSLQDSLDPASLEGKIVSADIRTLRDMARELELRLDNDHIVGLEKRARARGELHDIRVAIRRKEKEAALEEAASADLLAADYTKYQSEQLAMRDEEGLSLFDQFDRDGDGLLNSSELVEALLYRGYQPESVHEEYIAGVLSSSAVDEACFLADGSVAGLTANDFAVLWGQLNAHDRGDYDHLDAGENADARGRLGRSLRLMTGGDEASLPFEAWSPEHLAGWIGDVAKRMLVEQVPSRPNLYLDLEEAILSGRISGSRLLRLIDPIDDVDPDEVAIPPALAVLLADAAVMAGVQSMVKHQIEEEFSSPHLYRRSASAWVPEQEVADTPTLDTNADQVPQQQSLVDVFRWYDTDQNGLLAHEELERVVSDLNSSSFQCFANELSNGQNFDAALARTTQRLLQQYDNTGEGLALDPAGLQQLWHGETGQHLIANSADMAVDNYTTATDQPEYLQQQYEQQQQQQQQQIPQYQEIVQTAVDQQSTSRKKKGGGNCFSRAFGKEPSMSRYDQDAIAAHARGPSQGGAPSGPPPGFQAPGNGPSQGGPPSGPPPGFQAPGYGPSQGGPPSGPPPDAW